MAKLVKVGGVEVPANIANAILTVRNYMGLQAKRPGAGVCAVSINSAGKIAFSSSDPDSAAAPADVPPASAAGESKKDGLLSKVINDVKGADNKQSPELKDATLRVQAAQAIADQAQADADKAPGNKAAQKALKAAREEQLKAADLFQAAGGKLGGQ